MKNVIVSVLLAATILCSWVGVGHGQPAAPPDTLGPAPQSVRNCLQDCFDQHVDNLVACRASCEKCSFRFLGICFSWTIDDGCYTQCITLANTVSKACELSCITPAKPSQPAKPVEAVQP